MASRCIRLTRIHAIQWFGYCDTFDIHGNLLIAGRTGAGKSVLMDLIQLVLIGDQRSKYNAASDGRGHTSGRDKKSYCLCDTQEDINGVPQYARDGGITYIALEFTWPDGEQVETWGMRVDYPNTETQTPEEEFFRISERLERADFVTPEGYALDLDGFRILVRKKDGETFRNVTEYRKRLSEHLNFHRDTIDFLMPSAMSFAFLPKFDEFCRRYILQAEDIKIEPVQQSYRSYLRIREELEKLRDKAQRLEETIAARKEWEDARKDADACRFLEAEFQRAAVREEVATLEKKLAELNRRQEQQQKDYEEVCQSLTTKSQDLESLKNLFRDEGGALLLELQEQIRTKASQIRQLEQIGKTVEEEKKRRVRVTGEFAKKAAEFLAERNAGSPAELLLAIKSLEEGRTADMRAALRQTAQAVKAVVARVRTSIQNESEKFAQTKGELEALQSQIKNLDRNRVIPSPLLDELNRQLPRKGRENTARQLRELCEVTDEEWRPALELAFTRKFAVVTSADDYPAAMRIYKDFQQDSQHESLVDPDRALSKKPKVLEHSLAEKIESKHPVARAVLDELFGGVICVTALDDLRKHPDAIMPDGFRQRGMFAERPRRYDGFPCIGAKGIERLKAMLGAKADECSATIRRIEPLLARAEQIQRMVSEQKLDSEDIEGDINSASRLTELEKERDTLIARNSAASTPEMEKRIEAITALTNLVRSLDERRLELHGKLQSTEKNDISERLDDAKRSLDRAEKAYQETMTSVAAAIDVARCDALRAELTAQYPTDESRATKAGQRYREFEIRLPEIKSRLDLLRKGLVDQHVDLLAEPDFDPNTEWNPSYRKLLERIKVEDMPMRQKQALDEEQRWQELFKTTVAARLSQSLGKVRDTIRDLNFQLKNPIGDSLYHIRVDESPSREFQEYRRVLEACSVTQEGDSIFASLETEARAGVEKVFKALVDEPEGKLAQAFLDYRSYYRYDMDVSDPKRPELPAKSLNRHADKFSGGEKQTPFYISILACYLRAYKRHLPQRYTEPSIGLVPIDEAFSKMSGERITDAIRALRDTDLQGILSMSSGNWPYAIGECDQVLAVHQRDTFENGRKSIRNIGALLDRKEALKRSEEWG
ncbi:MAG: SbcC/MukB-like Walker B domain-containing protein [Chthoniobacteraceae bacterium]